MLAETLIPADSGEMELGHPELLPYGVSTFRVGLKRNIV